MSWARSRSTLGGQIVLSLMAANCLTPRLTDVPFSLGHVCYVFHGVSTQHFHVRATGYVVWDKAGLAAGKDVLQDTLCSDFMFHAEINRHSLARLVLLAGQELVTEKPFKL